MDEKQLWERLTAVEQGNKSAHRRIDSFDALANSIYGMVVEIKHMREAQEKTDGKIEGMDKKIEELTSKPAKRFELITTALISATVTGVVGFFLSNLL